MRIGSDKTGCWKVKNNDNKVHERKIKHQHPTSRIKHWGESDYLNVSAMHRLFITTDRNVVSNPLRHIFANNTVKQEKHTTIELTI